MRLDQTYRQAKLQSQICYYKRCNYYVFSYNMQVVLTINVNDTCFKCCAGLLKIVEPENGIYKVIE